MKKIFLATLVLFFTLQASAVQKKSGVSPIQAIQSSVAKFNQLSLTAAYQPQALGSFVKQEIIPMFDFDNIALQVLRASRQALPPRQTQLFTSKLKQDLLKTLLSKLLQNSVSSFQFISARRTRGEAISVSLKVNGYSRYGIYLDLLLHRSQQGNWQIFDVILNNDSLVNFYQKKLLAKTRRYGFNQALGKF
jgi:phospholipid transport system substrate-binding protein